MLPLWRFLFLLWETPAKPFLSHFVLPQDGYPMVYGALRLGKPRHDWLLFIPLFPQGGLWRGPLALGGNSTGKQGALHALVYFALERSFSLFLLVDSFHLFRSADQCDMRNILYVHEYAIKHTLMYFQKSRENTPIGIARGERQRREEHSGLSYCANFIISHTE